ncbi:hypothetical protein AAG747_01820 [Rapidithrix thailandica]|uniref:Lipoprotein n=1 Tax=Rapidithrix thailandica TaxID=413964 RepID=A0AAW9RU85_9BACT
MSLRILLHLLMLFLFLLAIAACNPSAESSQKDLTVNITGTFEGVWMATGGTPQTVSVSIEKVDNDEIRFTSKGHTLLVNLSGDPEKIIFNVPKQDYKDIVVTGTKKEHGGAGDFNLKTRKLSLSIHADESFDEIYLESFALEI